VRCEEWKVALQAQHGGATKTGFFVAVRKKRDGDKGLILAVLRRVSFISKSNVFVRHGKCWIKRF
jgi:hypothetical protein